ncbi:hypothetical protein [Acinetobacter sp. CE-15]|uniref:hypothetical protein n=1 Tax=Acinetobacter sp. CE-15 TaxID=3425693 RepID=UPI003DA45588
MFEDKTKNQHFISVAEQKLNAMNPNETKREKIRVYSFDLIDRERYTIELSSPSTIKAEKNLSYLDLYTFEILDDVQRLCFEKLFQRLENSVIECTNKILDENIFTVDEFLKVFKAKILNMIRNPYCIKFTLNSFGGLSDHYPTNIELKTKFNKINDYKVPKKFLETFNITEEDYKSWLKIIFLMITPLNSNKYILDEMAENFFNFEKYFHIINLFKYKNESCLLSDRSYVNLSSLFKSTNGLTFGFNLRHDAFIYMTFLPCDLEKLAKELLGERGQNIAKLLKINGVKQIQSNLVIQPHIDDLELLKNYNRHVIYQCVNNVYAAKESVLI